MGWLILFTGGFIYMPLISFYLVLAGGISYTIGSVLYALGRKTNLWFHTIFHCFIVIGTIIQALGIIMMISYQQCLQYDSNNIIANKKIIQLQSYSSTKAYISEPLLPSIPFFPE